MTALSYKDRVDGKDFYNIGIQLFESEELTSNLISIYINLMTNGWSGAHPTTPLPLEYLGRFYENGLWLSCIPRITISGELDIRNDGIADCAAMPFKTHTGSFEFCTVRRINTLPRGIRGMPFSDGFLWAARTYRSKDSRIDRRNGVSGNLLFDAWYYCLIGDRIVPTKGIVGYPHPEPASELAIYVAASLQTVADMKNMWVVETKEKIIGEMDTPLRLGVDSEIVKSLFYARSAPISESGRRRPILHWVRSHQRRLKEGIDIDVLKHLRGITDFEMDGFPFRIMNPLKEFSKAA